jgi:hypothetical protein
MSVRAFAERLIDAFVREVLGTRRKDVLRLIITEGPRFPQLLVAPGLMAVIWDALFSRFEPLDVDALMRAHLDMVLGQEETS